MSTEDNKAIVRQLFQEGPSKGNLAAAGELLSPNFSLHTPIPSSPGVQRQKRDSSPPAALHSGTWMSQWKIWSQRAIRWQPGSQLAAPTRAAL